MSLKYLLDINVCIYIAKQKPLSVLQRFDQLQVGEVAMSLVTYAELLFGVEKSQFREKSLGKLKELADLIPPLALPLEASHHYAQVRADLEGRGLGIGNNDLWIAAHALALDTSLVTNNQKEFSRIGQLRVENWV